MFPGPRRPEDDGTTPLRFRADADDMHILPAQGRLEVGQDRDTQAAGELLVEPLASWRHIGLVGQPDKPAPAVGPEGPGIVRLVRVVAGHQEDAEGRLCSRARWSRWDRRCGAVHLVGVGPAADDCGAVLDRHRLSGGERVAGPAQEAGGHFREALVRISSRGKWRTARAVPGEDTPVPPDGDLQQATSDPRDTDRDQRRRSGLEPGQGADLAGLHAAEGGELIGPAPEPVGARLQYPRELMLDPAVVGRQGDHHRGRDRSTNLARLQGLRDESASQRHRTVHASVSPTPTRRSRGLCIAPSNRSGLAPRRIPLLGCQPLQDEVLANWSSLVRSIGHDHPQSLPQRSPRHGMGVRRALRYSFEERRQRVYEVSATSSTPGAGSSGEGYAPWPLPLKDFPWEMPPSSTRWFAAGC